MSANLFGNLLKIMTFGESHGAGLGVVIDGCPANLEFDEAFLKCEMERRRPGIIAGTSARQEPDVVEILSGVFEGKTLGTPIAMLVRNQDARSHDYDDIKTSARPGHADDVWKKKFGHTDHRGGGRSSGRETVARVMAGAVAKMILKKLHPKLEIRGVVSEIAGQKMSEAEMQAFLQKAQAEGESYGGEATIFVHGMPEGLGQPVFHKLKADLASALMSVGATASVGIGDGADSAKQKGTEFHAKNPYGGIRGGISTGEDLILKVSFKPTSSILDVAKKGRHDPCIVIRAIPVLESMVALVLADHALW
jgi:chorismate synthase